MRVPQAASIQEIGLQEPIDVLEVEVDGDRFYYGFSGCHRFEAHERLVERGDTRFASIQCRIRKATPSTLRAHLS